MKTSLAVNEILPNVERINRRIYNVCYRFSGSSDDAQDLTQEVFIKMYRTLSSYDVEQGRS